MGPDLRTSARDLLTLAQKVSTVLQRHSDKLLGDIEGAQGSFAPEEEALFSEQSQQALDVRQQVWETSKSLKSALEHVEEIEDEDEPRILREKMDTLQVHIREGLKIASDIETMNSRIRKSKDPEAIKATAATAAGPKSESLPADTRATSGNSMGSWNRHPVGLFSTSPAKSPFATPAHSPAPRFTSTPKASIESPLGHVGPSGILTDSGSSPKVLAPKASMAQTSKSTLVTVNDDPLSMGILASVSDKPPPKDSNKERRHVATSSSRLSAAKTSPLITPSSPPAKLATISRPTVNTSSTTQTTDGKECVTPKAQEPHTKPPQRRRMPRGLFSSVSTSGAEPISGPTLGTDFDSNSINHTMSRGFSEGSAPQRDDGGSYVSPTPLSGSGLGIQGLDGILSSGRSSSSQSLSSQPQSPQSPITSAFSSPCISELKSPVSPSPLQRSQPKPSPIRISSSNSTPRSTSRNGKPHDDEEEISQLVRDLERAMNPTPTDPVPQVYFLQGEGMLERIPTQVSMDDGLLNDEGDSGQQSEDSDIAQGVQGEGSNLSRAGSGSLRRQRSGGKRRFRITRSRSRNRSRSRQENRNKPTLIPIEIGCPGTLASSEWPFEILAKVATPTGPRGRPRTSSVSGTLFPSRSQRDQATAYSARAQQWEPRAGPRLPFAESVSIGNPTRVGKGIGSFTVYSIALTLCATAKAAKQTTPNTNRVETNSFVSGGEDTQARLHIESDRSAGQEPGCSQVEGTSSEHDHPTLPKAPSKASLMLTRSLSSSDLNFSAERLWMSMHFPEDLSHGSSPIAPTSVIEPTLPSSATLTESEVSPTPEPGQTIHVLKRYTDFVTLRAQLVEMLKSQSRNSGVGRGRKLFSRSLSRNNVAPPAPLSSDTVAQTPPGHYSRVGGRDQSIGGYDDDGDDDDDDENRWVHSRTASGGTIVNSSSVSLTNILRGMPKLPPKKVVGKFRPAFVEKRRRELEYFLEWVVAHPIIGDCPVVVQWFLEDQF